MSAVVMFSGCATLAGDTSQPVSIFTACEGTTKVVSAECTITNDRGSKTISTPGAVLVNRSDQSLTVRCIRPNAREGTAILKSSGNWNMVGNVVGGGVLGLLVDAGSGAGFEYPKSVTVVMRCDTLNGVE